MKEIKKPKWDDYATRGVMGSHNFSDVEEPLKKGISITGKYKDRDIHMTITNEPSPGIFEAEIYDIEPNEATYEGLSIDDIVEIDRKHICWHDKK